MNVKKLVAFLMIAVMFKVFFIMGLFFIFEPTEEIKNEIKYIDKPYPIYIANVTSQSVSVFGIGVHEDNSTGEIVEVNILIDQIHLFLEVPPKY